MGDEQCGRCKRYLIASIVDGFCKPCRRHLGIAERPANDNHRGGPRVRRNARGKYKSNNPSREEVRKAYLKALERREIDIEKKHDEPSLPRIKWLERPMPRIFDDNF